MNETYRFAISDADLEANGVTGGISQNHGIFTWVLHDGHWQVHQNPLSAAGNGNFGGLYTLQADRITFVFAVPGARPGAPPPMTLSWKLESGQLRFKVIRGSDPVVRTWFTAHPWKKIG